MKRLIALMMCAVSLGAAAQSTITYPYNPDGNADSLISAPDIQDFLTVYGNNFVPNEIMVGDSTLSSWILSLSETASQQAAMISSLSELLNEQATIIDSLMDDGDEVHMFSIDSIQSGDWVTIASVGDLDQVGPNFPSMRADALFDFTYNQSSGHQRVQVKASHLFGKSNQLDIEHNRFYDNGSAISAFRIAFDNTYDGAVLQMRIQQPPCCQSVPVVMRIANNRNVPGWVVNPQILSNSVTPDNQPMVYGQVSDVAPFTQFYPSEAGTSLLEGDRTQAYMNTELHVNDLIVHGSLSGNDGQVGFVQIGAEVDCESAIQLPFGTVVFNGDNPSGSLHVLTPGPDCTSEPNFLFESDQVYGGMDLAMFCWFFEVTDSVYVFDLDVAEATEPEPVVTSMHIERVNETIDSAFNPSGTFGGFSYTRLLSTISDGYILLVPGQSYCLRSGGILDPTTQVSFSNAFPQFDEGLFVTISNWEYRWGGWMPSTRMALGTRGFKYSPTGKVWQTIIDW